MLRGRVEGEPSYASAVANRAFPWPVFLQNMPILGMLMPNMGTKAAPTAIRRPTGLADEVRALIARRQSAQQSA